MAYLDGKDVDPEPQDEDLLSEESSSSSIYQPGWLLGTAIFFLRAVCLLLYPILSLTTVVCGRQLLAIWEWKEKWSSPQERGDGADSGGGLSDASWPYAGQRLRQRAIETSKSNLRPVSRHLWPISEDRYTLEDSQSSQSTLQDSKEDCNICTDSFMQTALRHVRTCQHAFCQDCLRMYVLGRIRERRYPIACPVCVADGMQDSYVDPGLIEYLDIGGDNFLILVELQLAAHAVSVTCPRCRETMQVDRTQYLAEEIITCPLPRCQHRWCKACQKEIAMSKTTHRCKKNKLDELVRRKGWKYCPGCRVPVQKISGCNHITCLSPGCNVHFCYRCGELIIDTSAGGNVTNAIAVHYENCRQYGRRHLVRRSCTIQ